MSCSTSGSWMLPRFTTSGPRPRARLSQESFAAAASSPPESSQISAKLPISAAVRRGLQTVTSRPRSSRKVTLSWFSPLSLTCAKSSCTLFPSPWLPQPPERRSREHSPAIHNLFFIRSPIPSASLHLAQISNLVPPQASSFFSHTNSRDPSLTETLLSNPRNSLLTPRGFPLVRRASSRPYFSPSSYTPSARSPKQNTER